MEGQIYYQFIKLDLAQFAVFEENYTTGGSAELTSSFRFSYSFDENMVCCSSAVVITGSAGPMLKAELNSFFKITPESVASMTNDGCITLPVELMTQFASLCYGAMRGVIYAKTMGTPLNMIMLPPNDIHNIFTTPAKFNP